MKKIIITGVTGQDGSLLADYLLKNTEHTVLGGVRRLSVSNHKNIEHLKGSPRFRLVDLDITDAANVSGVIREEQPDYFVNFAANSFVGNSWDMPINHMETNCMAVLYQLEAIRQFAPHCRYYNAGSSEEFGNVSYTPQDEEHPLRPRSPYAASKCAARHLVKVYRESYGLYAVQGWLFNHEGVRRGEEFVTRKITKEVNRIVKLMRLHREVAPLELGNMDAKRDWSDAEDFVRAVWMMLNQQEERNNRVMRQFTPEDGIEGVQLVLSYDFDFDPKDYVVSSDETHTVREFVEAAFVSAGFGQETLEWQGEGENERLLIEGVEVVRVNPKFYRPAEVDVLCGDSSLARSELGWEPKTSFFGLVQKMVEHDANLYL